jgi:Cof subfamily protein (haloacid dehalogenase superfamily)
MKNIKLIATDIDGTILKYDFSFNKEVKDCIKRLSQIGIKVVLVTGRMQCAAKFIADQLELDTPIVSYQGGLIKEGDKILFERDLDPKKAREIMAWAKENNVHLNLYMNEKLYVEQDDDIIRRYTGERSGDFIVHDFDSLKLEHINKLLGIDFDNADRVTGWLNYLTKKYPDLYFVKSMPYFCEMANPEATKARAVEFLKGYYNLDTEEVLTIGDQNNDIALLKAGGVKIAMGNATQDLKSVADFVTDTVDNNGFVKAVEKFIPEYADKFSKV